MTLLPGIAIVIAGSYFLTQGADVLGVALFFIGFVVAGVAQGFEDGSITRHHR